MKLVFSENQFVEFLEGQTHPAKFRCGEQFWVVRYQTDNQCRNLRLASEFVGYCIAKLLNVSVPRFRLATIENTFRPCNESQIQIEAGTATSCEWLEGAWFPAFFCEPISSFWSQEPYLKLYSAVRVVDTWLMNFDRRKKGNVALRGDCMAPEVFFLDFGRSFLAKDKDKSIGYRPHWIDSSFDKCALYNKEVLSGFGDKQSESIQEYRRMRFFLDDYNRSVQENFKAIIKLDCEELKQGKDKPLKMPDFLCRDSFSGKEILVEITRKYKGEQSLKFKKSCEYFFREVREQLKGKLPGGFVAEVPNSEQLTWSKGKKGRTRLQQKLIVLIQKQSAKLKFKQEIELSEPIPIWIKKVNDNSSDIKFVPKFLFEGLSKKYIQKETFSEKTFIEADEKFSNALCDYLNAETFLLLWNKYELIEEPDDIRVFDEEIDLSEYNSISHVYMVDTKKDWIAKLD